MGKIETLLSQIQQCDTFSQMILESNDIEIFEQVETFVYAMSNTYLKQMPTITVCTMGTDFTDKHGVRNSLNQLRMMLVNMKDEVEDTYSKRSGNLKTAVPSILITQSQNNTQSQNVNISVTIDQVFDAIKKIPKEVLQQDEKDELEDKLSAVEAAKNVKDKGKLAAKIGAVMKYIVDKGIEVGIAVLPYLGEIARLYKGM